MSTLWLLTCIPGAVIWIIVLLLPWRPWSIRERLEGKVDPEPSDLNDLTVVIPARNEEKQLGRTLEALRSQAPGFRVLVIDDRSDDRTAEVAAAAGLSHLRVIEGRPLQDGWTGKLWALEQGLQEIKTPLILLLDADIELRPGIISKLLEFRRLHALQMVSLMATLETKGFWEKLLFPAFVYFFKLLYPFRLANSASRWVAAGAGGCVLVETEALRKINAFSSLKDELIDDCALASRVKAAGHRIWIGLSHSVVSHREYEGLSEIWDMVARTAYTQLRYSPVLLALCVIALSWAFWLPVVGLVEGDVTARIASITALTTMVLTYLPTLHFYRQSCFWALLLPFTGTLYLAMTVNSAWRYYRGVRSTWRGRDYFVLTPNE